MKIRNTNNEEDEFSYRSDVNIKLKYYGEKHGYDIKFQDEDFDDTMTMQGYDDPHVEQDTLTTTFRDDINKTTLNTGNQGKTHIS